MDKIEKLFRKISFKDRARLIVAIDLLTKNNLTGLDIKKLVKSEFYRLRCGRFRIFFKKERGENIIYQIKLRNDNTYSAL